MTGASSSAHISRGRTVIPVGISIFAAEFRVELVKESYTFPLEKVVSDFLQLLGKLVPGELGASIQNARQYIIYSLIVLL